MTADLAQAWTRFPLVCRPHLHLPSLTTRVETACAHADAATASTDPTERHRRALNAWNLAALIAADLGHTDLSGRWCREQYALLARHAPLTGRAAIDALQTLLNLARLTARSGAPGRAFDELAAVHHGTRHGGRAIVHGQPVDFDTLLVHPADTDVTGWTDTAMLHDGTVLLMRTHDWARAAAHARAFDPAPAEGGPALQCTLVDQIAHDRIHQVPARRSAAPGERAVLACLQAYSHLATGHGLAPDPVVLYDTVLRTRTTTDQVSRLFGVRLALTVIDLATRTVPEQVPSWLDGLVDEVLSLPDARPAQEVVTDPRVQESLAPGHRKALLGRTAAAGLLAPQSSALVPSHLEHAVDAARMVVTRR